MRGQMHSNRMFMQSRQARWKGGRVMGRTIVDNPEHPAGIVVWRLIHYAVNQLIEGEDAVRVFNLTDDRSMKYIQRRLISECPEAFIFEFNLPGMFGDRRPGRVTQCSPHWTVHRDRICRPHFSSAESI